MKRLVSHAGPVMLLAFALVAVVIVAGCGNGKTTDITDTVPEVFRVPERSTTPAETTPDGATSEEQDRELLVAYVDGQASQNPDFDHNDFKRIDFAVDNQGNRWAIVEVDTYYESAPDEGLYEANVFELVNGEWTRITGGSGGYSEGVPIEVQQQLDIEGR